MSTEVSDIPAVDGGLPTTDVFVARRKQILATIAPVDAGLEPPEPPAMPVADGAAAEPTHDDPLDDDGYPAEASSAGFLQFPSGDDDDDDLADDDLGGTYATGEQFAAEVSFLLGKLRAIREKEAAHE